MSEAEHVEVFTAGARKPLLMTKTERARQAEDFSSKLIAEVQRLQELDEQNARDMNDGKPARQHCTPEAIANFVRQHRVAARCLMNTIDEE